MIGVKRNLEMRRATLGNQLQGFLQCRQEGPLRRATAMHGLERQANIVLFRKRQQHIQGTA